MKKIILLLAIPCLIACEKTIEQKETVYQNQPQQEPEKEECDCYVWESELVLANVNGVVRYVQEWNKGRYFGSNCSDEGKTFEENGNPSQVRCTKKD